MSIASRGWEHSLPHTVGEESTTNNYKHYRIRQNEQGNLFQDRNKSHNQECLSMQKYEYICVAIVGMGERTTKILNEYGQQGWELVDVVWIYHYFKRPLN